MSAADVTVRLRPGASPEHLATVVERLGRAFGTRVDGIVRDPDELTVRVHVRTASESELDRLRSSWFADLRAVEFVTVTAGH